MSAWHLPFGAELLQPGRTRFRFWAPAQRHVGLAIEGGAVLPMARAGGGWFELEVPLGAGTAYRYRLDEGRLVPDPASRAQAGGVHGPSLVVDPSYPWRHQWRGRPWPETVLYELHTGLLGGFAGVERALPRLAALGVTAIELMPVADFPGRRNWGYDGVLPFAPAAAYGPPAALKALIDAAHGHGLMVFLDVVYNHFGPDGNYLGLYAPAFFRRDLDSPWGQAIDFRQPEVRAFFTQNALYWLMEYRIDGLRLDAVQAIPEADWLDEMAVQVRATVGRDRQVHLVLEHDGNVASHLAGGFDAQWNDDAHHVLHVLLTGQRDGYYADYDDPTPQLARALAEGFIYQGELSRHRGRPRGTRSGGLPPTAFVLFLQNHDQIGNRPCGDRLSRLADPQALEAAIALQLLCPQIPLLFMGEEFASPTPFLFFTDHQEPLAAAVREGRRREFAGFSAFAGELPDPNAPATFERSRPTADTVLCAQRLALYRRLLAIRRQRIVPRLAGAHAIGARVLGPGAVLASWRMGDGARLTLATNLGAAPVPIEESGGELLFASSGDGGRLPARATVAYLEPAE
jgi:maltooligosyltrehalose trehalohydrolase